MSSETAACNCIVVDTPLRFSAKFGLAVLCVALSLVFAGASAASLVDKVQHQGPSAHAHEHIIFSVAFEDHHQDGEQDDHADEVVQGDEATADHQPGVGHHHHADGSTGFVAVGEPLEALASRLGGRLAPPSDHLIRSPGSPGPERPPKRLAISV